MMHQIKKNPSSHYHRLARAHYTLASGHLGAGDLTAALRHYVNVDSVAVTAHEAREPWALQMILEARLGLGAVCLAAASWNRGAQIYADLALPVAQELKDHYSQIECHRLAALCEERAGEFRAAWDHCIDACAVAELLPQAERNATTLTFVGDAMVRIAQQSGHFHLEFSAKELMTLLLGSNWQTELFTEAPRPAAAA